MRTSTWTDTPAGAATRRSRGFTLVEVLVVVLVIGLTVALVSVKLQRDDRQIVRDEARRLAALLTQARDEAITTGASLAWHGGGNTYGFLRRNPARAWQPFDEAEIFRRRTLPEAMRLASVEIAGHPATGEDVLVFSSTGVVPPFRMVFAYGTERVSVRSETPARITVERVE